MLDELARPPRNILGGCTRIGVAAYCTDAGTIYWCQQFAP